MVILAAGGGSGGHVTPVLAVLQELKKHDKNLKAFFVTDKIFGPQAVKMFETLPFDVSIKQINAGKFRRFHKISWVKQLFNFKTVFNNAIDLFLTSAGLLQSMWLVYKVKPDVVFAKGGFVCLPIGLAAHFFKVPLVIHDSDAHPGLTSRILSKYARVIATGSPAENYPYPKEKTHYVGIPVATSFRPLKLEQMRKCKAKLGLTDLNRPLVVVTGGGLGARNLNHVIVSVAPSLLKTAAIFHLTGRDNYQETIERAPEHVDYIIKPFVGTGMPMIFGAADVVVTRAGATAMSELAAMAKPTVIVPNPYLTAGHQIKNAKVFAKAKAAIVVEEEKLILNPMLLKRAIESVIDDKKKQVSLAKAIYKFARPDAAIDMATLIVSAAFHGKKKQGRA